MSFGTSTIYNLPRIATYAAAHRHFTRTELPKTKRRGTAIWSSDERPLGNKTLWHYRLEASRQGNDTGPDYYEVCLYNTTMARFHRPEADGSEIREYVTHSSKASSTFMSSVLGIGHYSIRDVTTASKPVEIPIGHRLHDTSLCFTADDVLDVSRSRHPVAHKHIATAGIKAWRKETKAHLSTLTMLWELMVPEWAAEEGMQHAELCKQRGRGIALDTGWEFTTLVNKSQLYKNMRASAYITGKVVTQTQVEGAQALYVACVPFAVQRKLWNDDIAPIVPANITKSFLRHLEEVLDEGWPRDPYLPHRTERKPLAKFVEKLPKGWTL
jgi:hypothetical protein